MSSINLADDEYIAVVAAIQRTIEDDRFPRARASIPCARH
jgi:hypothetical protein